MTDYEYNDKSWQPPESGIDQSSETIRLTDLTADTWLKLTAVYSAKIACAFAWGASFQTVNPMLKNVFLGDLLPFPLPPSIQDLSASILINITLGIMAVVLPSVLWHFAIKYDVLRNPGDYFVNNPLRILICIMLITSYGLTISLEVMSLMNRVNGTLNTGPIPVLGVQPEFLPLAIASAALVLGSCLLGLASASLAQSIRTRHAGQH